MKFDYYKPKTLQALLELKGADCAVLAGGTDLLVDLRSGKKSVARVLDIKAIPDFYGICEKDGGLEIGACETFTSLLQSPYIKRYPALKEASEVMGCYEIRNRATLGGNICNSSPGCESGVVLSVYEALVRVVSRRGRRDVPFAEFCTGVNRTALAPDEVVLSLFIPVWEPSISLYRRITRTEGMDLACWNGAALIINPKNPSEREVRISFGTVTPTPHRSRNAEALLSRRKLTRKDADAAYDVICSEIAPRAGSVRASPEQKKRAIRNFLYELVDTLER